MAILTVFLERVTNLGGGDLIGKSDPYVKLELEQDNLVFDKNFGEKKSSTKNDEQNPIYNETFTWEIPSNMGINNLVLWVKIMDDDLLKDDKIGKCKINLEDLDLSPTPLSLERVVDNNILTKDARIYLKISYQP